VNPVCTQHPAAMTNGSRGQPSVFVVTVTYGDRQSLLQNVLVGLADQGVAKAVVVDNGAPWPVTATLTAQYGTFIDVVSMGRNTGSAGGYAAGIQRAIDLGAEFLWLLDDDNCPDSRCLEALLQAHDTLRKQYLPAQLAVAAYRPEHQTRITAGVTTSKDRTRPSGFCWCHLTDVPLKVLAYMPWCRRHGALRSTVISDVAPYGGLLVHRSVINAIGIPNTDFVLYEDDTEFTYRLTSGGGCIALATRARIKDLEHSWPTRRSVRSMRILSLFRSGAEMRVFYGVRNRVYLESHVFPRNRIMFALNRLAFNTLMAIATCRVGGAARRRLVRRAIMDGLQGRLGADPQFPLT